MNIIRVLTSSVLVCVLGTLFCAPFAEGVFVASDTPNANNSQPTGDQGWTSMGTYNNAGAAYVGDGWFLTARHLGTSQTSVNLGGTNHAIDSSSWTSITNSNGSYADVKMFRTENPGDIPVPGTPIYTNTLSLSDSVTMIGYGRDVSSVVTNTYTGNKTAIKYYQGSVSSMKWAENQISRTDFSVTDAQGRTSDAFETTISDGYGQALDKDSGGGVFVYDDVLSEYRLAGIMIGVNYLGSDETGIYATIDERPTVNDSMTIAVNVPFYQDQINQAVPEPSMALFICFAAAVYLIRTRFMGRFGGDKMKANAKYSQ